MFSTKAAPYEKLNPVGQRRRNGRIWRGRGPSADASADLALDVTPPAQPSANQLPVTATVRARYNPRAQVMDFSALTMTTPHSHVDATGTLGSTSAALHVVLNTTSLTEFQPLLTAMGSPPPPVELAGMASFNGTLSGRLKDPQIAGHVQASDFTYIYTPSVPGSAPDSDASSSEEEFALPLRVCTAAASAATNGTTAAASTSISSPGMCSTRPRAWPCITASFKKVTRA